MTTLTNWAGNVAFSARQVHQPATVSELQQIIAASDRVRALGTGHSFNEIADSPGDLVSVAALPATIDVDSERRRVRVAGGLRYGEITGRLHDAGLALHNLGSLPHISVAGACATATHGSGRRNGNLATAVAEVDLVTASGDLVTLTRDDPSYAGAVVALGCLGIVTALTLDAIPTFDIAQTVYDDTPLDAVVGHLDEILDAAYSISMFTTWRAPAVDQIWAKRVVTDDEPVPDPLVGFGASAATTPRHPVPGMPAEHCTPQLAAPGPWHARLPHFRLEFQPSAGDELQSEYFVDRTDAVAVLQSLDEIRDVIAPVLHVSEIRTIAADSLWLSPAHGRDSVAFHFTWKSDVAAVLPVVAEVERRLASYAPRPHWGKLFSMPPEDVRGCYPRLDDFVSLAQRFDPAGKFRNAWVDRYVMGMGV